MSISNHIEKYIVESIGNNNSIKLSRIELSNQFNCSPSQINYVLLTRFSPDRGYIVESKRGGSGCINVNKIVESEDNVLANIYGHLISMESISYNKCSDIICRLVRDNIITQRESLIILVSISDKALIAGVDCVGKLRVQILIGIVLQLSRRVS